MRLRNGAHVDRILDINPIANAQHNASSPLLRLPLEVKNLIYNYTFGGNVIHITQTSERDTTKFTNTICRASISEEEAQDNFDNESSDPWLAPANEDRHAECRSGTSDEPGSLNLSLLRSCRQLYNEAHHIPYSTNTFSCALPKTLQQFVLLLAQGNNENHLAVRSLLIEMVIESGNRYHEWKLPIATCARCLKKLKNVNISFEWKCWHWMHRSRIPVVSDARGRGLHPYLSQISVLKRLPLEHATFVISDSGIRNIPLEFASVQWRQNRLVQELRSRWRLLEKQDWARRVKEIILKIKQ